MNSFARWRKNNVALDSRSEGSMKVGCLDYNFNYLPVPSKASRLGTYSSMGLARLGVVKRYRYTKLALRKISQLGFGGAQVMCEDVNHMTMKPHELADFCYNLDLDITSLGGYANFFDGVEKFIKVIDYAAEAGVQIVCTHSGSGENKKIMMKNIAKAVDYAASHGVIIALENSPLHAVKTVNDVLSVLKEMPKLRLNFDPANFSLANVDTLEAVKKLGKYFVHVHAKDSRRPFSFPPIGKGEVPWPQLLAELNKFYKGYLVIEFEGRGDPLLQTAQDKAYLENIIKGL